MSAQVTPDDIDVAARLVFMDGRPTGPIALKRAVEESLDALLTPSEVGRLWTKYAGFDGRQPTHDYETGLPL